jgi:hypothetical protein
MRDKNQGINLLLFPLSLAFVALLTSCHEVKSAVDSESIIVFEGTIERLAPNPEFVSGWNAVYRLAKYRVERVCAGEFEGKEIVIDHIVFDRKEFEGVNVGDRVCVAAKISSRIDTRIDADDIRSPSQNVTTFYIAANKITRADQTVKCCGSAR